MPMGAPTAHEVLRATKPRCSRFRFPVPGSAAQFWVPGSAPQFEVLGSQFRVRNCSWLIFNSEPGTRNLEFLLNLELGTWNLELYWALGTWDFVESPEPVLRKLEGPVLSIPAVRLESLDKSQDRRGVSLLARSLSWMRAE